LHPPAVATITSPAVAERFIKRPCFVEEND
jgi:hypothetical protein